MTDQDFPADDTAAGSATTPPDTVDPTPVPHPDNTAGPADDELDLAAIEADLDDVQAALARLADDSYWTDEVTGEPIPADVLAANPLTRRA